MATSGVGVGMTEEEEALRDLAERFFSERVRPMNEQLESDPVAHVPPVFAEMGSLGLIGPWLDERFGGGGGRIHSRAIVSMEAARVNAGLDVSMFAHSMLCSRAIARLGTEEQKARYLPRLLNGRAIGAMAITEPSGGSNALAPRSKGVRGDGGWIVNGDKTFITNAPVADLVVLIGRTSGEDRQIDGGTWFILQRGMEGLTLGEPFEKAGWKSSPTGQVSALDVFVPESHVLGPVGGGFRYLVDSLDAERVLVGASTVGITQGCLDQAATWVTDRHVFGRPIADYQLVQEKIAVTSGRLLLVKSFLFRLLDALERRERVTLEAAALKLQATEMAVQAALDTVQLLGGAAYVDGNPAVRVLCDAKLHEIGAGTSEIMKLIIFRETMRRMGSGPR